MTTRRLSTGLRVCPLLCLALVAGAPAAAQRINLPPVTRTALPNGARVWLMEYRRAPTAVITAIFPGGTATDPAGKAGTTGLMASLLRRGTRTRTAPQIAEAIDFVGGSLDAAAGDDRVVVSLDVLTAHLDAGLDLMADAIRNATFPAEELARARQLELAGLAAISEDPGAVADRVATETVYAGHPYGALPTVESVQAITRDDLVAAYRRIVGPDRMILVAVGDFRSADMLARLKARFADWPRAGLVPAAVPPVAQVVPSVVVIDKPDATQTQVRLVRTGLSRGSPLEFPARMANGILGGGFTSRLTEQIRVNRSLTYGIGSSFDAHQRGGSFSVSTFTRVPQTRALLDATRTVLADAAARGFTATEMSRVKGYTAGLFAIRVQTPEEMAGQLGDMAFFGLPDDYLQTYLPRLRAVTPAQAAAVARQYFAPQTLATVLVGPAAGIVPQLKGLGRIETRPVESVGKRASTPPASPGRSTEVDQKTKERVDRWIKETGRNQYGDPRDTVYAGGTPLFDERTGRTRDRYEYILDRHPELRKE